MGHISQSPVIAGVVVASFGLASAQAAELGGNSVDELLQRPPSLQAPSGPSSPIATVESRALPDAGSKTITVQRYAFVGNTVFDTTTLQAIVSPYLGKPLSLPELYAVTDVVTEYYTSRGYSLASAILPAQNVTSGEVMIEVLEGRVDSLEITGLKSYSKSTLLAYLPEIQGKIYQGKRFERGLRDIDELPGLTGKAVLKPSKNYGGTDVVVEAMEDRIEGEVFFDNSGRESVGEYRMAAQVTVNNPLGSGDALTVLGLRSTNDRLHYLHGSYALPFGAGGGTLKLSYGLAQFRLQDDFRGVEGSNRNARGEITLPVVRTAADRLSASIAINRVDADTDLSGVTFSESEFTVLELASSYAHTWRNRAVSQLNLGIGSNFRSYSANARSNQKLRMELDAQQFQPLKYGVQVLARVNWAYSPDPVPDVQAYALGGPASVRGYAPSEVRGDWGYLGSLTLRRPMQLGSGVLVPRVFADAGRVRNRLPTGADASLSAAGVGVDFSLRQLSFRMDYAIPMDGRVTSDDHDNGRVYASLSIGF